MLSGARAMRNELESTGSDASLRRTSQGRERTLAVSKGLQIALGAFVVAGLLGWYAATNLDRIGTFQYYQTLKEFRAAGADGAAVRVHGYVAPGSIQRDVGRREIRFTVVNDPPHQGAADPTAPLAVVYDTLETPDMFKEGAEVVVEGHLDGSDATFVADNVMAKCPSKFQAKATEPAPF
jgi:cytochrome c-type biogenesis protein CcmE